MSQTENTPPEHTVNKRNEPRVPIELKVEYKRINAFFADYTQNISKGGTFIKTEKPLPVGTEFVFKLVLPGGSASQETQTMELKGKVQWVCTTESQTETQKPGMGIGFVFENSKEQQDIAHRVEVLLTSELGTILTDRLLKKS